MLEQSLRITTQCHSGVRTPQYHVFEFYKTGLSLETIHSLLQCSLNRQHAGTWHTFGFYYRHSHKTSMNFISKYIGWRSLIAKDFSVTLCFRDRLLDEKAGQDEQTSLLRSLRYERNFTLMIA